MNIDIASKWFASAASIFVIIGVISGIVGVFIATKTFKQTQRAASATLVLKLRDTLAEDRYTKITNEIQGNNSKHPLLIDRGGQFKDTGIEEYIGNLEDIGYLVQEKVIDPQMAYNHFSYDVEKAWCNEDVQSVVQNARKADKSTTATSDPIYGKFETLAKSYLAREGQTCNDLENQ